MYVHLYVYNLGSTIMSKTGYITKQPENLITTGTL